jgi:hypothetical protein
MSYLLGFSENSWAGNLYLLRQQSAAVSKARPGNTSTG